MKPFPYERPFTKEESALLAEGFTPATQDDRWHMVWENDDLHFKRSWTGTTIFSVQFIKQQGFMLAVSALMNDNPEEYRLSSEEAPAEALNALINTILLKLPNAYLGKTIDYIVDRREELLLKSLCQKYKVDLQEIHNNVAAFLYLCEKVPASEFHLRDLYQRIEEQQKPGPPDYFRGDYSIAEKKYHDLKLKVIQESVRKKFNSKVMNKDSDLTPDMSWLEEGDVNEWGFVGQPDENFNAWLNEHQTTLASIASKMDLSVSEQDFMHFYGKDLAIRECECCGISEPKLKFLKLTGNAQSFEPMQVKVREKTIVSEELSPYFIMFCQECASVPEEPLAQHFKMIFAVDDYLDWDRNIFEAANKFKDKFKVYPEILTANEATIHTIDLFMSKKLLAEGRVDELKQITVFQCSSFSVKICFDFELQNHEFALIYDDKAEFVENPEEESVRV